ncbi:hypothetical protein [Micromonospora sp. NPDC003776]
MAKGPETTAMFAVNQPEKPSRRRRITKQRITTMFATLVIAVSAMTFIAVQPAAADTVNGYAGAGLVITVNTGAKNYNNRTQYIGSIYVLDTAGWICDNSDPTEAWAGSVWYTSATGCPRGSLFTIDRWVPSGSGVCGSYYRWKSFPGTYPWSPPRVERFRFIACITISV